MKELCIFLGRSTTTSGSTDFFLLRDAAGKVWVESFQAPADAKAAPRYKSTIHEYQFPDHKVGGKRLSQLVTARLKELDSPPPARASAPASAPAPARRKRL